MTQAKLPIRLPAGGARAQRGFSLIELLVVIAIIAIVSTMAVSGLRLAAEGGDLDKALIGVSSGLEVARQAAVAQATYTWVFLAEDDLGAEGNVVTMVMIASRSGDLSGASSNDYRLLGKPEQFRGVKFGSEGDVSGIETPVRSGVRFLDPNSPSLPVGLDLANLLPEALRSREFEGGRARAVLFSPNGEAALVKAGQTSSSQVPIYEALQLVIVPSKGANPSESEKKAASLVVVNGVTGLPTVHQRM